MLLGEGLTLSVLVSVLQTVGVTIVSEVLAQAIELYINVNCFYSARAVV